MGPSPIWVSPLCEIARGWRTTDSSIRALFERAAPDLTDGDAVKQVRAYLEADRGLVDAWQTYSSDKRGSPSPYLNGLEVGHYDGGRLDVVHHRDPVDACSDFIWREARWVLARQR